jgi:alpha-amylase
MKKVFDRFRRRTSWVVALLILVTVLPVPAPANPWNGKVVLQAFWWDCWNERYPQDWYTYLAKLAPRIRSLGFDGIWIPSPAKGNAGSSSMGYDIFDHYDLGDKDQKGTVATRFGDKDSLLRLIAVAHANGLDVYPDIVLNQVMGGETEADAPGDKYKRFRYQAFAGEEAGRWPKDHWNFHPNPDHWCASGSICEQKFGPDVCYLDAEHGGGGNGRYMLDQSREWFVWLKKQLDADGFRFDAVKHFSPYVVGDLLYNAMGNRLDYFSVGEFVGSTWQQDEWIKRVGSRSGTFDFGLRDALANIVEAGGYFDMGNLPDYQQNNRLKTSPFINSHDTWRGAFWDSEPGSKEHDDRSGDWRRNDDELAPTIDPDNERADVAYAAAFALDGNPTVYYEDLFVNSGEDRFNADPDTLAVRPYIANLVWTHQKLGFKDGVYKVRYQGSQDLLVIERSAHALIGLNDHGSQPQAAWVQTDFAPGTRLHDYSGNTDENLVTDEHGWVKVVVPSMSYAVWGPSGIEPGFAPAERRTTQEFQLDDDVGDARDNTPGYGGKIQPGVYRTAGSVWAAAGSVVKVWLYTDGERKAELRAYQPDETGARSREQGDHVKAGPVSNTSPLYLEFTAEREGYHQLAATLPQDNQAPTRGYVKVEYQAPAESEKF